MKHNQNEQLSLLSLYENAKNYEGIETKEFRWNKQCSVSTLKLLHNIAEYTFIILYFKMCEKIAKMELLQLTASN
jgi:hypothetical protein